MDFDLEKDYYKILGVTEDTSADDIKKAYLKMAKKHHPDVNGNSEESKEKFQEIQEAYDVLSHHSKKARYDGMSGVLVMMDIRLVLETQGLI